MAQSYRTLSSTAVLPAQTGNSGTYLTTNGITTSWGTVAAAVPKITSIPITDSSYTVLDDTAVSTAGGYIKIIGTGFTAGSQVLIGTVLATSVTFISSTELRAQVPATGAGTYVVYVVATDGAVAIRVNGITFSTTPTWTTSSSLGTYSATISIQLAAASDTTITYSLASGSTLPTGLSLSSSGLLSGTVTGVSADVTYNFTITATDLELQDSPRTFSITLTVKDPYFPAVPLLLKTAASSTASTVVTDFSTNAFTVTRTGTPSTGWTSPYQTDGYWGNYFTGSSTGAYLTTPTNTAFQLTTSNFTIEFWAFFIDSSASSACVCRTDTGGSGYNGMLVGYNDGTNILWYATTDGAAWNIINGGVICTVASVKNKWAHFAFVRNGSTFTAYVNGVQTYTTTSSASIYQAANGFRIGTANNSSDTTNFGGYISNFRYVKGVAVYTGAFTTPTGPLAATQSAGTNISAITGTATSLLTCQSNRFIDNSTANSGVGFAITVAGTPRVTPDWYPSTFTAPAASPGAGYFNGTTDYLTVASNTAFAFGASDYTVECWMYTTAATRQVLFASGGTGTNNFYLSFEPTFIGVGTQAVYVLQGTTTVSSNIWYHVAASRASGTLKLFLNGVQVASGADGTNWIQGGLTAVGNNSQGSQYFSGYISNLRIVKGTAVYTGAFAPPTGFLTQTGGTYSSTTNVNTSITATNTSLLVNLGDSNYTSSINTATNNTFIDSGPYAYPITRVGTTTQGSFTPYWPNGYWSNYFGDLSANNLTVSSPASNFLFAGDFTIEAWYWASSGGDASVFVQFSSPNYFAFNINPTAGNFSIYLNSGSPTISPTATIPLSQWNHIALVRSGSGSGNVKVYLNGNALATTATNTSTLGYSSTSYTRIGGGQTQAGVYISNFRVVKGTAVYTGNFTPPTGPLAATQSAGTNISAITGTATSLLTCQSNRFIDNSSNALALALTGTVSTVAFQPFSPPAPYTTAAYGGSIYNSVKTDGLSATSVASLTTFTGDFTIDCWVYPTDTSVSSWGIIDTRTSGQTAAAWVWYLVSYSAGWNLQFFNGSYNNFTTKIQANCWTHVVLQRNGTTLRAFINGVVDATTFTISGTITGGSSTLSINNIKDSSLAGTGNVGYTSNLRFVNGTAVYATTGFTPPTAPVTAIANTSLLLNYTNSGIYDASAQNNATTAGSAQASTTIVKWSPTSMKFNGTTDYLSFPVLPTYSLGTGDFTLEGWFYFNAFNTAGGGDHWLVSLGQGYSAGGPYHAWALRYNGSAYGNAILALTSYNGTDYSSQFSFSSANYLVINTWYHIACSRSGSSLRMFLNGSQVSTTATNSNAFNAVNSDPLQVGKFITGAGTYYHNGYMQDVRLTKGYARYTTASFTLPTLAYQSQ